MPTLRETADRLAAEEFARGFSDYHLGISDYDPTRHLGTFWKALAPAGQAADAITTVVMIHKLKGGARESNPVMAPLVGKSVFGDAAFIIGKVAVGAGIAYIGARLAHDGHQTGGKIVTGIAGVLGFGAAIHNVSLRR